MFFYAFLYKMELFFAVALLRYSWIRGNAVVYSENRMINEYFALWGKNRLYPTLFYAIIILR